MIGLDILPTTALTDDAERWRIPIAWLLVARTTFAGLHQTKWDEWDDLFSQAEPTVCLLVGNCEYDRMGEADKQGLTRNIVDSMIGINKATIVVAGGKIQTHNRPAEDFARFGGTRVLIVQEGHAVVLERGGRRSRFVGTGVWHLEMFERVKRVVPFTLQSQQVEIENVVTQVRVMIERIKLTIFSRFVLGDRSHANDAFPFEARIINDRLWSPKPNTEVANWSIAIKSVPDTATRDLVARVVLDDLVLAGARTNRAADFQVVVKRWQESYDRALDSANMYAQGVALVLRGLIFFLRDEAWWDQAALYCTDGAILFESASSIRIDHIDRDPNENNFVAAKGIAWFAVGHICESQYGDKDRWERGLNAYERATKLLEESDVTLSAEADERRRNLIRDLAQASARPNKQDAPPATTPPAPASEPAKPPPPAVASAPPQTQRAPTPPHGDWFNFG